MIKKLNNKKSESELGIFHLLDLKIVKNIQSEQFYFELKKNYKEKFFNTALSISKDIIDLSKQTNINYSNLWDCIKRQPISLSNLKKISVFLVDNGLLEFSLEKIEKKIDYMKGGFTPEKIYSPKFPINLATESGMRFISHIYHDGGIGEKNRQPNFTNQSLDECKEFLEDSKTIFGNFDRNIKIRKDGTYRVELPTIIGDILVSIGYIKGDRTKQNAKTFNFLTNIKDNGLISEFLAKAFNDDGTVGKRQIVLEQSSLIIDGIRKPSNVLLLDKIFLERLDIKVLGPSLSGIYQNRYGECTKYLIRICSRGNMRKFYSSIKLIDHKKGKLERYLNAQKISTKNGSSSHNIKNNAFFSAN